MKTTQNTKDRIKDITLDVRMNMLLAIAPPLNNDRYSISTKATLSKFMKTNNEND